MAGGQASFEMLTLNEPTQKTAVWKAPLLDYNSVACSGFVAATFANFFTSSSSFAT